MTRFLLLLTLLILPLQSLAADSPKPKDLTGWVPPKATDWVSIENLLTSSYLNAVKQHPSIKSKLGRPVNARMAVDRTTGKVFLNAHTKCLWLSEDMGQTYKPIDIGGNWSWDETPTSLYVCPDDGKKIVCWAFGQNGFSKDGGKTWTHISITTNIEDGHINWHGDWKTIIARQHYPKKTVISHDGGTTFSEFHKSHKTVSTHHIAMMQNGAMLFQTGRWWGNALKIVRTDDKGKTFTTIAQPKHSAQNTGFIGISRQFKGKVYWGNNVGVYTSSDNGLTWTLVGRHFPKEWINGNNLLTGPMFGIDENHMLMLYPDKITETFDGGKSWHILAHTPVRLNSIHWGPCFAYDPVNDILYCRSKGKGTSVVGRLALKRWGPVEKTPPTDPSAVSKVVLDTGNQVRIDWKDSTDASGIAFYRIYLDGALKYHTVDDRSEIVLHDLTWKKSVKVGIQAVDNFHNKSKIVDMEVTTAPYPKGAVNLRDLTPASAKTNAGEMKIMLGKDTRTAKHVPVRLQASHLFAPRAQLQCVKVDAVNGFGIHAEKKWKTGTLTYKLNKKYKRLLVDIGKAEGDWYPQQLTVKVDGVKKGHLSTDYYRRRTSGIPATAFDLDLTGAETLSFEIANRTSRPDGDLVVLNNAMLFLAK